MSYNGEHYHGIYGQDPSHQSHSYRGPTPDVTAPSDGVFRSTFPDIEGSPPDAVHCYSPEDRSLSPEPATPDNNQAAPATPQRPALSPEWQVIRACEKTMNSYLAGWDYRVLWKRRRARAPASTDYFPCWSSKGISPTTALSELEKLSKWELSYMGMAKRHYLAKRKVQGSKELMEDIVIRSWKKIMNARSLHSENIIHVWVLEGWLEVRQIQLTLSDLLEAWRGPEIDPGTLGPDPSPLDVANLFEQAMVSSSYSFMGKAQRELNKVAIHYTVYPEDNDSLEESDSDWDNATSAFCGPDTETSNAFGSDLAVGEEYDWGLGPFPSTQPGDPSDPSDSTDKDVSENLTCREFMESGAGKI